MMERAWSRRCPRLDLGWVLGLLALAGGCYLPVVLSGQTTLLPISDNLNQWWLYRDFIRGAFSSGRFPLWCPGLYCGLPFAGWAHAGVWYPFAFSFFLMDYVRAVPWNQWWHLNLTLLGFYALARSLKLSAHAAGLASVWYGFSCFLALNLENFLPQLSALSLTPWVLTGMIRLAQKPAWKYFVFTAATVGIQVLSGHFEAIAHQFLLAGLAAVLGVALTRKFRSRAAWQQILPALIAVAAGLFLGLILVLPAAEFVSKSVRALPLSYAFFTNFSSPLFIIFQAEYGQFNLLFLFVFAAGALTALREHRARVALLLVAFSMVYAGNLFQIQRIFYHLPVFSKFSSPWRMNHHEFLVLALVAGMGVDRILQSRRLGAWLTAAALVLIVSWAVPRGLEESWGSPIPAALSAAEELPLSQYKHQVLEQYRQCRPGLALAGILAGVAAIGWRRSHRQVLTGIFLALFLGQCFIPALRYLPRKSPADYDLNPDYRSFLAQAGQGRILNLMRLGFFPSSRILPQAGILSKTEAVNAFISIPLLSYAGYVKAIFDRAYVVKEGLLDEINFIPIFMVAGNFRETQIPLWDLMNLRYVLTVGMNFALGPRNHLIFNRDFWQNERGTLTIAWNPENPAITGSSPSGFTQPDLYFEPDGELRFGVALPESIRGPEPNWVGAFIFSRRQDTREPGLVFSRFYPGPTGSRAQKYVRSLARLATSESLFSLSFSAAPLAASAASAGVRWEDPTLISPSHHFQALPVPGLEVYGNPSAMPKAFLAVRPLVIPKFEDRVAYLRSGKFQPWSEVLLEEEPGVAISPGPSAINREGVEIIFDEPDRVGLRAAVGRSAWLVLTDVYFPGWRAWVDGKETRIWRADQTFRGLQLDPGLHSIQMRYQPRSFRIGLWVTLSSLLSIFLFSGLGLYGQVKPPKPN